MAGNWAALPHMPETEKAAARIIWRSSVDSTNALARRMIQSGELPLASGRELGVSVVLADRQEDGHGRLGRRWVSEPGASLTASFVCPIPTNLATDPRFNGWLPMIAGLASLDALTQTLAACQAEPCAPDCSLQLKWPNDIYCQGLKLGGILAELVPLVGERTRMGLILGIGMNLSLGAERHPTPQTTSLHMHWSPLPPITDLSDRILAALTRSLAARLQDFCADPQAQSTVLLEECSGKSWTLGRQVEARLAAGGSLVGRATALNPDASLTIEDDQGQSQQVHTGDVGILP
ncbi:biotin--[acetyl-CoA-carboxylase] ligase [Bifidobacterium aemilianum]|uniref:Biotin--[acetyl-CoA-carboxylase] ligase n=2 Tax=Bifidobacterium aemilianum TaxID=2493120 RepID=A0A366KAN6_9BIFI|nr:biotin--[acetyl-CoA-carboxylase] ligase [Bifidobacterium aemilianum]RBP97731.1 biotin--[acetyl-CoA-carboxylase] ligase [Bifidobacterium aemilianum]